MLIGRGNLICLLKNGSVANESKNRTVAGVGVFLYFYFTQGGSPPVVGGNSLSLCLNGTKIENGGSLGLLDSGQEFTVENAEKYDVQIYA